MLRRRQTGLLKLAPMSVAFAVLGATPLFAEDAPTEAEREAFIAAVTANGCHMTNDEAEKILPPLGFSHETARAVADALVAEGLAYVTEGETMYVLKTEGCAP